MSSSYSPSHFTTMCIFPNKEVQLEISAERISVPACGPDVASCEPLANELSSFAATARLLRPACDIVSSAALHAPPAHMASASATAASASTKGTRWMMHGQACTPNSVPDSGVEEDDELASRASRRSAAATTASEGGTPVGGASAASAAVSRPTSPAASAATTSQASTAARTAVSSLGEDGSAALLSAPTADGRQTSESVTEYVFHFGRLAWRVPMPRGGKPGLHHPHSEAHAGTLCIASSWAYRCTPPRLSTLQFSERACIWCGKSFATCHRLLWHHRLCHDRVLATLQVRSFYAPLMRARCDPLFSP